MSRRAEFDVASLDFTLADTERDSHELSAHLGGQRVGVIEWHAATGAVDMVQTHNAHRGKGIASALWGAAHVHAARHGLVPPKHSSFKLPDGQHWANKQTVQSGPGKKQPRRKTLTRTPGEGQETLF